MIDGICCFMSSRVSHLFSGGQGGTKHTKMNLAIWGPCLCLSLRLRLMACRKPILFSSMVWPFIPYESCIINTPSSSGSVFQTHALLSIYSAVFRPTLALQNFKSRCCILSSDSLWVVLVCLAIACILQSFQCIYL